MADLGTSKLASQPAISRGQVDNRAIHFRCCLLGRWRGPWQLLCNLRPTGYWFIGWLYKAPPQLGPECGERYPGLDRTDARMPGSGVNSRFGYARRQMSQYKHDNDLGTSYQVWERPGDGEFLKYKTPASPAEQPLRKRFWRLVLRSPGDLRTYLAVCFEDMDRLSFVSGLCLS